ncbi:MAG: hypothetical protein ACR2QB_09840 [Gammaproteobacteria bacterium]
MSAHTWLHDDLHLPHWHLPKIGHENLIGLGVAAGLVGLWLAAGQPWPLALHSQGAGGLTAPLPAEIEPTPLRIQDSLQWQGQDPIALPKEPSILDPLPANA